MIEINLLPGPKKKRGGAGISLPDFQKLAASVKDPLLLGAVAAWIIAGSVIGLIWFSVSSEQRRLDPILDQTRREARTYRQLTARKRRMEQLRDSLIVELDAIRGIDADRYVWPHIMSEVTRALPDFTWLVSIDNLAGAPVLDQGDGTTPPPPPPIRFSIEGRTSDVQAYTRFVRQLEASPWLRDIQLGATQTVVEDERQVISFQVEGTFEQADSAFINTAPVAVR